MRMKKIFPVGLALALTVLAGCTGTGNYGAYGSNAYDSRYQQAPGQNYGNNGNNYYDDRYQQTAGPNYDNRTDRWRQNYSRTYTYNDDSYYQECRNSPDPAGVIAGALIGGLFGNAVGRGSGRGGATVAGVIVGGVVGAALTSNLDCDDRSYAYRSYYDGFNAGRPNASYQWRNPRNDHRGEFRVDNYYDDRDGFRCANYGQTIYVQGRPQEARGVACRQPDGSWAIVS